MRAGKTRRRTDKKVVPEMNYHLPSIYLKSLRSHTFAATPFSRRFWSFFSFFHLYYFLSFFFFFQLLFFSCFGLFFAVLISLCRSFNIFTSDLLFFCVLQTGICQGIYLILRFWVWVYSLLFPPRAVQYELFECFPLLTTSHTYLPVSFPIFPPKI